MKPKWFKVKSKKVPGMADNFERVVNLEHVEDISLNGANVRFEMADGSYTEEYASEQEAASRYDEIKQALIGGQPKTHKAVPLINAKALKEYSIIATEDEIVVNNGQTNISYPFSPVNCLLNAHQSAHMATSDIWSELFDMYSDMGYPVGPVERSTKPMTDEELELMDHLILRAVHISKATSVDIFVRYSGHTDELEIDIHINGWKANNEPDFKYSTCPVCSWGVDTFNLVTLKELETVLNLIEKVDVPKLKGDYIADIRSYVMQGRSTL